MPTRTRPTAALLIPIACLLSPHRAHTQALPTATQPLQISLFAGATGTYTGLGNGRNLAVTAGADLSFPRIFTVRPALELRGTYPIDDGQVDSQRNILAGLKLEQPFGRFHPYADLLFGRGQINYGTGYPTPSRDSYFIQSISNVLSPGLGLDVQLTNQLSLKLDAQLQHFNSPVTTSGHLYAKPLTLGLTYRFSFDHRRR